MAYNNVVHHSTGLNPFQVVMGKEFPTIPELDVQDPDPGTPTEWADKIREIWPQVKLALQKAADEYKQQADKKRADPKPFQVGDRVYLSTKYLKLRTPSRKLGPKYVGPFTVTKVINPVPVALKLPPLLGKVHPVFHSILLKPVEATLLTPQGLWLMTITRKMKSSIPGCLEERSGTSSAGKGTRTQMPHG